MAGGVGYKVATTKETLGQLSVGAKATLWTHLAVREDVLDLYGFQNERELQFFELLLTVPSVGPKSALAILNVASSASFLALPGIAPYNVSKAGVLSLSETLAAELAGTGVRIGVLCPTLVKTGIPRSARTPANRLALAEKIMARVGMTPEAAALYALDGLDRDRFYLVPQIDAQLLWHLKRHTPRLHTRLMGVLERLTEARYGDRG